MRSFFNKGCEKINTVLQKMDEHKMSRGFKRSLSPQKTESQRSFGSEDFAVFYLLLDLDCFVEKRIQDRGNIFISQNGGTPSDDFRPILEPRVFDTKSLILKGDASNVMNFSTIIRFIELLDREILSSSTKDIIYTVESGHRALTNAIFLLGAYMILKLDFAPAEIHTRFSQIDRNLVTQCSNVESSKDFEIKLMDWWGGLRRAKENGWISIPQDGVSGNQWGLINKTHHENFGCSYNGDMHVVVPEKFVAFSGPKNLGGNKFFYNYLRGTREFSPEYFVDIFNQLGVSTILRFDVAQYDIKSFTGRGFAHYDLSFDDCTSPSPSIIGQFFKIVDKCKGPIAIHCKTGLGQTPTMIALYMMRTHGFTAMQAIAWLRMLRPGSVGPEQQRFLCSVGNAFGSLTAEKALNQPNGGEPVSPRKILAVPKPEHTKHESRTDLPRAVRSAAIHEQIRDELEHWSERSPKPAAVRRASMLAQKSFTARDNAMAARNCMLQQRSFESGRGNNTLRRNSLTPMVL